MFVMRFGFFGILLFIMQWTFAADQCDVDDTPYLDGEIRFGGLVNTGNTDNKHVDGAIELKYAKDPWALNTELGANWSKNNEETNAKRVDFNLEVQRKRRYYDFFFGDYKGNWNPFGTYELTHTLVMGYGSNIYHSKAANLLLQAGPGIRGNKISGSDEHKTEGLIHFEGEFKYQINQETSFRQTINVDSGDFNTVSKTASVIRTKMIRHVSLELSYNTLRNSKIPSESKNKKRLDSTTKINIVYEFT